jgi:hypothetical protein
VVTATPQLLYPRESKQVPTIWNPGVGVRAALKTCGKSQIHRDFFCALVDRFDRVDLLVARVTNMGQITLLSLPKEGML